MAELQSQPLRSIEKWIENISRAGGWEGVGAEKMPFYVMEHLQKRM